VRSYIAAMLALIALIGPAWGQTQTGISQKTGGECSPAVVSQGKVTITCIGLDPRQQEVLRRMPGLIDQLLKRSQSDRAEILTKLEEILKLEERNKPRILTAEQTADFVNALRMLPNGAINLGFTSGGGDEGFKFAQQLLPLFKEAGWTVRNEASITNHLEIAVTGVGILSRGPTGPDPNKPPSGYITLTPTLATIRGAFAAVGIDVQFINWQPGRDDAPEVVVGSKPQP
jgi:hypothetical protein